MNDVRDWIDLIGAEAEKVKPMPLSDRLILLSERVMFSPMKLGKIRWHAPPPLRWHTDPGVQS